MPFPGAAGSVWSGTCGLTGKKRWEFEWADGDPERDGPDQVGRIDTAEAWEAGVKELVETARPAKDEL